MQTRSRASLCVAALLLGVAVALVPWSVLLNQQLPSRHLASHWDLAWTGFDLALAAAILATAISALRGSTEWLGRLAAASGTMLVCDAWFDVLTSSTRTEVIVAVVEAGAAELPLALLCFAIARRPARFARSAASVKPR
jgi:hypothetical protein